MILGLFGDTLSTLKTILFMFIVIAILIVVIKYPDIRKVAYLCLGVGIFFAGCYSAVFNLRYFTVEGHTYGEIIESLKKKPLDDVKIEVSDKLQWNITNFDFSETSDVNIYKCEFNFDGKNELINLPIKKYALYINNGKVLVNENGNDYIKSEFNYSFYDNDNKLILSDILYFNFGFYAKSSSLIITTKGGSNAVKLWRAYQAKNGFMLELKEEDNNLTFDEINIDEPVENGAGVVGYELKTTKINSSSSAFCELKIYVPYADLLYRLGSEVYNCRPFVYGGFTLDPNNAKDFYICGYVAQKDGEVTFFEGKSYVCYTFSIQVLKSGSECEYGIFNEAQCYDSSGKNVTVYNYVLNGLTFYKTNTNSMFSDDSFYTNKLNNGVTIKPCPGTASYNFVYSDVSINVEKGAQYIIRCVPQYDN